MTASLLIFVPVALLVLVSAFCFIGCALDTAGLPGGNPPPPTPFNKYSDIDVIPSAIAYWPLDEMAPADNTMKLTAHDAKGANDGEYKHKGNAPTLFPCPAFQLSPGVDSAAAIGFLSLGANAIVPGDAKQPPANPLVLKTGMQVDGAFVTVPFNAAINPAVFTVEAWVRAEWDPATAAFRAIVDSRNVVGAQVSGFEIGANEANQWEGRLGVTGANPILVVTGSPVTPKAATHVVLTFNGTNAALFINGMPAGNASLLGGTTFVPNTGAPLVIGVGLPWLPPRTQPTDNNFFPLLPFNGTIQDVAIYDTPLDPGVINTHFQDGSGNGPPEPAT